MCVAREIATSISGGAAGLAVVYGAMIVRVAVKESARAKAAMNRHDRVLQGIRRELTGAISSGNEEAQDRLRRVLAENIDAFQEELDQLIVAADARWFENLFGTGVLGASGVAAPFVISGPPGWAIGGTLLAAGSLFGVATYLEGSTSHKM